MVKGIAFYRGLYKQLWVCLKMSCTPINENGFADHYPIFKWLFHWEYTIFSDKPLYTIYRILYHAVSTCGFINSRIYTSKSSLSTGHILRVNLTEKSQVVTHMIYELQRESHRQEDLLHIHIRSGCWGIILGSKSAISLANSLYFACGNFNRRPQHLQLISKPFPGSPFL